MKKGLKWTLIVVGSLLLLFFVAKAASKGDDEGVKVTVDKAAKRTIVETVTASGKVYPEVEVKVSPDISGEVTELYVAEGDSVQRGQVLARVYADVLSDQRDQAASQVAQSQASVANSSAALAAQQAQVDQARANYNRNKQLFDEKVISKAELETFETQLRTAEAQLNASRQGIRGLQASVQGSRTQLSVANKNLGRTTIVAPMSGVISLLAVKKGERVVGTQQMAGTEMMRVADMSRIEVRVEVGENDVVKVAVGQEADVTVDAYNNRKFKGVVTAIAATTLKTGGSTQMTGNEVTNYEVRIRLDPASFVDLFKPGVAKQFPFRPGMNASADIKTRQESNVVSVPLTSVAARVKGSDINTEQQKKEKDKQAKKDGDEMAEGEVANDELESVVWVLAADGTVQRKVVTTGIQDINNIQILTGLTGGEQIVTAPYNAVSKTLKSGTKVKVVEKDKLF